MTLAKGGVSGLLFAGGLLAWILVHGVRGEGGGETFPRDGVAAESPVGPPHEDAPAECRGGCRTVRPQDPLSPAEIRQLLGQVATQEVAAATPEVETLLFHGRQVLGYLEVHGGAPLDEVRQRVLRDELARNHVTLALRVVDKTGRTRVALRDTVPVGEKQHLHAQEVYDIHPPEVSFTVKRVGLHHLWMRI